MVIHTSKGSRPLAMFLVGLFFAGCGGSSEQGFSKGGVVSDSPPAVLGRVTTGGPADGAEVTFFAPDGGLLDRTVTDPDGFFDTDANLPTNFRVKVSLPDGTPLATEIEGFHSQSKHIVVNIPTSLVAGYHARHPEVSLEQSVRLVKRFLGINEALHLEALDDSLRAHFIYEVFLEEAAKNGGVRPFLETLLSELESQGLHSFIVGASPSEGDGFLTSCAKSMAKNALKDEGIGWASKALGINSPLTSNSDLAKKLAAISDQITALAGQLTEFEAQAEYTAAVNKLGNDVVIPTSSTAAALLETLEESQQNPITTWWDFNSPNPVVENLTNAYSLYSAKSGLDELVSYLLGTYNPDGAKKRLERLLVAVVNPPLGIDSDLAVYNGYGAYSNDTLKEQRAMIEYYFQVLEQAAEVYSEQAHNAEDPQTLVTNIRTGQAYLATLARVKKQVLQQLPDPLPSDDIFVDREWGLVWYMGNPGKGGSHVTNDKALDFVAKFPGVGPYTDGWRLPTPGEINHLYLRIEAGAKAKSIAHDKRALVLERWGWDLSYMTDVHQVWSSEYGIRVSLDTGKRHDDSIFNDNDVIMVRDFPKSGAVGAPESIPSLVPPLSELSVTSLMIGGASFSTPPAQQQLSAAAALSSNSGGDFTVDGTSYSHPANTGVSVGSVDVTSRVVWTSSNDSMASVSNFEGSEGQLTWHSQLNNQPLQPVTITATFLGNSTQTTFQPPTRLPPVLDSLWVSPYNVGFEQPTVATPIQTRFGAILFYLDPTTGDSLVQSSNEANAPTLTWSLSDKVSGAALTRTAQDSGFEDGSLLVLTSTLATTDMNVKATTGTISGIGPIHAAIVPGP